MDFSRFVDIELQQYETVRTPDRVGGKQAKIGARFEDELLFTHQRYEAKRLGIVTKNNVSVGINARGHKFYRAKQTTDFQGYLAGVGHVSFEAKSTEEKCFKIKNEQIHQFCFLLIGSRNMPRTLARFFYLIERRWKELGREKTRKYLVEDLEQIYQAGRYEFADKDIVGPSRIGAQVDYRAKLLIDSTPMPNGEIVEGG